MNENGAIFLLYIAKQLYKCSAVFNAMYVYSAVPRSCWARWEIITKHITKEVYDAQD